MKTLSNLPWEVVKFKGWSPNIVGSDGIDICEMNKDSSIGVQSLNAISIVDAVNYTYGRGVKPSAVPLLFAFVGSMIELGCSRPTELPVEFHNAAIALIAEATLSSDGK